MTEDIEENGNGEKPYEAIVSELQAIQRDLYDLEEIYPDLHEHVESLQKRIGQHESMLQDLSDKSEAKMLSEEMTHETANVVATAMASTIAYMEDIAREVQQALLEKAQLDVMIQQLTKARYDVLKQIPEKPAH